MTSTGLGRLMPTHDPRWDDGKRLESCVCGGTLVAYLGDDIREVVDAHNASAAHQRWRLRDTPGEYASLPLARMATPSIIRVLSQPNTEGV